MPSDALRQQLGHITIGDDFPEQVSDAAIYTGFAVLAMSLALTLWTVLT